MLNDNPEGPFEYRLQKENLAAKFSFYKTYWQHKLNPIVVEFNLSEKQDIEKSIAFWKQNKPKLSKQSAQKILKQLMKDVKISTSEVTEKLTDITSHAADMVYFFNNISAGLDEIEIMKKFSFDDYTEWVKKTFQDSNFYTTGVVPNEEALNCEKYVQTLN